MTATGRLDPAVAAVRRAVRAGLADLAPGCRVVVACSGGPDSMALAAATAFESARAGWLPAAVVIDHGLQDGSAAVAATVRTRLQTLTPFRGLTAVDVVAVAVCGSGGPEGAARRVRQEALRAAAGDGGIVVLGHTRDDQAETVLLGLARGSGARSLAGMRARRDPFRRPLLDISRAQTVAACAALGIPVWHDPQNADERFARVRVRRSVLPMLEDQLGPGVAPALARTARLLAADADALEALAAELATRARRTGADGEPCWEVEPLASAPPALRTRVLRLAALAAGCPGGELFEVHVSALDALVCSWHGQRGVDLPGGLTAYRRPDGLVFAAKPPA